MEQAAPGERGTRAASRTKLYCLQWELDKGAPEKREGQGQRAAQGCT